MRRIVLAGIGICSLIVIQAFAQCQKTHLLAQGQFGKEDKGQFWNLNNQSKSGAFEKGKTYEMTFIAYEGYEYRVATTTDVESAANVNFELAHDVIVRVKDGNGRTDMKRQRETIFDNTAEGMEQYVVFSTDKTQKFYVTVSVPATGSSSDRKLTNTDRVCMGVAIFHRKTERLGF